MFMFERNGDLSKNEYLCLSLNVMLTLVKMLIENVNN